MIKFSKIKVGDNMSNEEMFIDLVVDKKPYIKNLTNDPIINLTGESGSGKSFYAQQYLNDSNYIVIDTDEVFASFDIATSYNLEFGTYLREKYEVLPDLFNDFDLFYQEVLDYFDGCEKTVVIDSALFKAIKDITKLKGKIIVMRTSVNTCYDRCLERYKKKFPDYKEEDFINYKERKSHIFKWYLEMNEFLKRVEEVKI